MGRSSKPLSFKPHPHVNITHECSAEPGTAPAAAWQAEQGPHFFCFKRIQTKTEKKTQGGVNATTQNKLSP